MEVSTFENLMKRIDNRQAQLGVVGLGFVGLPLSVAKAQAGYQVIGFDIDEQKINAINRGTSYIDDVPTQELREQVESGRLRATADFSEISKVDAVSICVPTPIDQYRNPDALVGDSKQHDVSGYHGGSCQADSGIARSENRSGCVSCVLARTYRSG